MWRGRNPATTAEATIYEFGAVGGPAAPCTAPLATGPSTPDMTAATDTGSSATDNVTSNPSPSFVGVTGLASATTVNLYVDGTLNGSAAVGAGGSYGFSPTTPIADGRTASPRERCRPRASRPVRADPCPRRSTPPHRLPRWSPGRCRVLLAALAPAVNGTSEGGSTVQVFDDAACTTVRGSSSARTRRYRRRLTARPARPPVSSVWPRTWRATGPGARPARLCTPRTPWPRQRPRSGPRAPRGW